MTNQENFKKDTENLFNSILTYKSRYRFVSNGKNPKALDLFERELRTMLEIVRTDEENTQQYRSDSMC